MPFRIGCALLGIVHLFVGIAHIGTMADAIVHTALAGAALWYMK